ncbi:VIR protein [Plasmodium vivax]|uniref:VIR protein n=1 Tax=Plasmodium vivax TaxID=5855 RepID=A0A1G4GS88_PLAVI|nr:VIR protein [Plasmodium vivax]
MDPFSTLIEGWQKKYSFLEKVLNLFVGFNAIVNDESNNGPYSSCYFIPIRENEHENRPKYKYFCMKLMRNIWSIEKLEDKDVAADGTESEEDLKQTLESKKNLHCNYLNMWIPYYLKKYGDIPDYFINNVFDITHKMIKANPNGYQCKYDSYNDKFIEPHNMAKLHIFSLIFGDFIEIIRIKQEKEHDDFFKYIRVCAAIYKKINKTHCPNDYKRTELKLAHTCNELQNFKSTYESELSKVQWISENLPKLDDELTEAEQRILLEQEEYDAAQNGFSSTLQRNITTGAVTAAGTGALLLALNKFTPARKLFRSGKRRIPEVENILEGRPSEELFLNDPDYVPMNSDTTRYNVGYGSMENY